MRILVVDDDPDLCLLMEMFLTRAGHEVVIAADGREGWQHLEANEKSPHAIDFVVLDWMMPHLDGIELARAVRRDARFGRLPLLMVTARDDLEEPSAAGIDGIVPKPFSGALLVRAVDELGDRLRVQGVSA